MIRYLHTNLPELKALKPYCFIDVLRIYMTVKEIDIYADGLTEQYKNELLWLEQYYKNPVPVGAYTYASHCVESQIIVLDKMFASQLWDAVATLCKEIMDDASLEIADIV